MVGEDQEVFGFIQKILRSSPRGLTISDLSKKINKNRTITAKYLDILNAEGKVETRQVGSARIYWLSQRVPLSAFLCFTKNMIVIVDMEMNIVQVNNQYMSLSGLSKEELIGRNIIENGLPILSNPKTMDIIRSTEREQIITDVWFWRDGIEYYYKMEVIPTLFDEENKGLTIVLEDITEQKQHEKNMEFLARTAIELVELPPDADIYEYVSERVVELLPGNPRCFVESFDLASGRFVMKAVQGQEFLESVCSLLGYDIVGLSFPIVEFFSAAPFYETPLTLRAMREMRFRPFFEDEEVSFYDLCAHMFPEKACNAMLLRFNLAKVYLTGLVWQDRLYGIVGIFLGKDETLQNKLVIESFLRQASISIARRQTEEQLSRSIRHVDEFISAIPTPAILIDNINRIIKINPIFTKEFGFTRDDCVHLGEWLQSTIPDQECREKVLLTVQDSERKTSLKSPVIPVRCHDQTEKKVRIKQVPLSGGMRALFFEPLNPAS